jgi:hypothetical protein
VIYRVFFKKKTQAQSAADSPGAQNEHKTE